MPQQCRPSEGRAPFHDVPTIQIFPGKLAFITSGQRISFQRCQPTIPPRIVQAGLAGWLAGLVAGQGGGGGRREGGREGGRESERVGSWWSEVRASARAVQVRV